MLRGQEQVHKKEDKKTIPKANIKIRKKKDGNGTLSKKEDDYNFLSFCLFGMNGQKKQVSKEGVPYNTTYNLNGHIFLVLLEK